MSSYTGYIYKKIAAQTAYNLLQNDFVILDTETTGLDSTARVVSLAMVDREGRELIDTLINPGRPIPRDATAIHGITDDDVVSAPTMNQIAPQIENIYATRPTYIYNADYDLRILKQHIGRPPNILRSQCIMKLYAEFKGDRGNYGDFKWHKLTVACSHLGVSHIEAKAHSALGDCLRTLAVLRGMAKWYEQNK